VSASSRDIAGETPSRDELAALQLDRLRATVQRLLTRVPVVRERLHAAGVTSAQQLGSLDDLAALPFATKGDLREHYPFGLLAVAREEVARIHASSGTSGKPTVVAYTAADLEMWTAVMARSMAIAGVRAGMLVHNANGYGLFTGGFGFHQGAERLGATVIPVSAGFTARQALLLADLRSQVLVATPSYALTIAQALRDAGTGPGDLALELGLFGGEPWTESMRAALDEQLGLESINIYGLSEIVGPGVAVECREVRDGLHVNEDHFLAEVIDPDSGRPRPLGEEGELVFTTLTKEALPMLRYRSGDIAALIEAPCPCGRTLRRMTAVRGRRDDMLIVRGVNLYPSTIEHVLVGLDGMSPHYQLVVQRPGTMDELIVRCEPAVPGADRAALTQRVAHELREATGLTMVVEVREPGDLPRSEGKALRVLDHRYSGT
jgi:phenylacetate-CoA ligase